MQPRTPFSPLPKSEQNAIVLRSACHLCGKSGHRAEYHSQYGSLSAGVKSVDRLSDTCTKIHSNPSRDKTVKFDMAMLSRFTAAAHPDTVSHALGPFVDDGPPYSAIGILNLRVITDDLCVNPDQLL